jgi:hypothetical protein
MDLDGVGYREERWILTPPYNLHKNIQRIVLKYFMIVKQKRLVFMKYDMSMFSVILMNTAI